MGNLHVCNHNCDINSTAENIHELDFKKSLHYAAVNNDLEKAKKLSLTTLRSIINNYDSSGYTPMHYAVRNGNYEFVQFLLNNGACVHILTKHGQVSSLHRAVMSGSLSMVRLLLENGSNPLIVDSDLRSVLDVAERCGNAEIIDMIKKYYL